MLNIKKNDEIIIPAHTYCASAIPFAKRGAKIIWADIDLKTKVIDLEDVKKKITKNESNYCCAFIWFCYDISKFLKLEKIKLLKTVHKLLTNLRNKKSWHFW